MNKNWFLILALAALTYISRVAGVRVMAGRKLPPMARRYFQYVPVAVMASLVASQAVTGARGRLGVSLPVLAACLAAAAVMRFSRQFLPAVGAGIAAGLLVRFLL